MASEQRSPEEQFEDAMRRLGWLSAYSRQVLLTRHLLRNFETISHPDDLFAVVPGEFALDLFRVAITALSGINRETQKFSSPYEPINRPDTHYLAYNRRKRVFSASIASGMPEVTFYHSSDGLIGLENSNGVTLEDQLFVKEIFDTAKGIGLTNKADADRRVEQLRNEKLWRGIDNASARQALNFFNNWYEWAGHEGTFWRTWYQGFVSGTPIDWELQRRIALIEDAVWDAGPSAVAAEIAKVEAAFLLEKHPIAEDVFYNEETARFGREPRPILQQERHEAVLISVRDAVEAASTGNYLHAGEYHIKTLSKMLETNSKHPHVIEQKLVRVARSLRREMEKEDGLPDAPEIEGLAEVCDENAIEMRALYPEVAKARAEKSAQRVLEASPEERQVLDSAKEVIGQITEEEFGAEIVDDIDAIRETSEMADAGRGEVDADAVGRTGNRLAKIWLLTKKIAKGTAIGGGAVIVGAEGIAAINEALPILLRLLGL